MSEIEALKSLGPFVLVQAAVALVIIGVGVWLMLRGSVDKKNAQTVNGSGWNGYAVREAMEILREIGEQNRERDRILNRIEEMMKGTGKMQWEAVTALERIEQTVKEKLVQERQQTMLLEDLRNNQVMRADGSAGIPRRK